MLVAPLNSSTNTFLELKVAPELAQRLSEAGMTTPTPIQALAIPLGLIGRDVIGQAQTGTGKTLAFGVPMLQRLEASASERGLVIAPTRELAIQIVEVLRKLTELEVALVIGGLNMRQQKRELKLNPRIIVATPGRLVDHLQNNNDNLEKVAVLVLDEADRMLDMGFAPQLNQILKQLPSARQTMLFSATVPPNIQDLARKYLRNPERVSVGGESRQLEALNHEIIETVRSEKKSLLIKEVLKREGTIIVFTRTKDRTELMYFNLRDKGIAVTRIHGDRGQLQRQEALKGFRDGTFRVLVATDIAARGLDVPHIAHVINLDLPQAAEDFVHRIGRTARAGKEGNALTILTEEDREQWFEIQRVLNPSAGPGVTAPVKAKPLKRSGGGGDYGPKDLKGPPPKKGKVAFKFSKRRS